MDWLTALAVVIALALLLYFAKRLVIARLAAWSQKTETRLDDCAVDILAGTRFLFLLIIAFYFGSQYLELPPKPTRLITHFAVIALLVQVALWGNRGIVLWLNDYLERHRDTDAASATTVSVLGFIARVALWSVLLLMILDNLGFNITTLVASLGIGGVAVALAVAEHPGRPLRLALHRPRQAVRDRRFHRRRRYRSARSNTSASRPPACAACRASRSCSPTPTC